MTPLDFITNLFCRIDDEMRAFPNPPQAGLGPSEVRALGVLHALKGVGNRAFDRWLTQDSHARFPRLPERTRRFRSLATHRWWTLRFLARPTLLGVIDRYGIELLHPLREGRSPRQLGRKGISTHRWIGGSKLGLLVNRWGGVVGGLRAPAHVHDTRFHPLLQVFQERMLILADPGFHARDGDPPTLKVGPRGPWNDRLVIETVYSMLTLISQTPKMRHRGIDSLEARLAFPVAAFNLLIQWDGLNSEPDGFIPLSIAEFSL